MSRPKFDVFCQANHARRQLALQSGASIGNEPHTFRQTREKMVRFPGSKGGPDQ